MEQKVFSCTIVIIYFVLNIIDNLPTTLLSL